MKIIKNGSTIIVVTDDGEVLHKEGCSYELYNTLKTADRNTILSYMLEGYNEALDAISEAEEYINRCKESSILSFKGDSVYWEDVSELSMPKSLVEAVLEAEENDDADKLEAYRNFWVLLSLNPDSRCRENLYWFLDKWGMKISKSGLFIGYRNVDVYKPGTKSIYTLKLSCFVQKAYAKVITECCDPRNYWVVIDENTEELLLVKESSAKYYSLSEEDNLIWLNLKSIYSELKAVDFKYENMGDDTIYTDRHSRTFRIKVGEPVSMPREDCDSCQDNTCSRGLHVASAGWLSDNYFGSQGLVCLINPRDVVAVPPQDSYGKMRCCKYLPIALVDFDDSGRVIPYDVDNGFESSWIKEVLYDGETSTEDTPTYKINIPNIPELDKTIVDDNLLAIARTYVKE